MGKRTLGLLIALAALVFVGMAVVGVEALLKARRALTPVAQDLRLKQVGERRAREERQEAIDVRPAPLPTALPLLGAPGPGPYGYAAQYVDQPAMRSLLVHKKFQDLARYLEQLQDAFEKDPMCEYWPEDAAMAFDSAEPDLLAGANEFVAAVPDSFAPYLVRGAVQRAIAGAVRGGAWAQDTPGADLADMVEPAKRALTDLDKAIALRPKLVAAMSLELRAAQLARSGRLRGIVDQASAVCPTCFRVRSLYLINTTPRWGGSYEAMRQVARAARDAANPSAKLGDFGQAPKGPVNPKLKLLAAYPDIDRAELLRMAKKTDEALAALDDAARIGELDATLYARAEIEVDRKNYAAALTLLDRAIELRPGMPSYRIKRAEVHSWLKQNEPAGRDLLAGIRVDSTSPMARALYLQLVHNVSYELNQAYNAKKPKEEVSRTFDLMDDLCPRCALVRQWKEALLLGTLKAEQDDLAKLEEATKQAPDDLLAHQRFNLALGRRQQFARAIEMWTGFIARNSNAGRAYYERAGLFYRLDQYADCRRDAAKACELGVGEACSLERRAAQPSL